LKKEGEDDLLDLDESSSKVEEGLAETFNQGVPQQSMNAADCNSIQVQLPHKAPKAGTLGANVQA